MNQLQTDTTLRVKTCDNVVSVVWEADDLTHTQSSYDKTRPGYLQDNFAQLMAGGMLLGHEQFPLRGRAAHLGVGGGVLARFTCDTLHMQTHGVELSPTMTALARLLFGLREEVQLTQADGMRWIARPECSDAFELIVSHMFLPGTLGPLPATREFCESCRAALNPAEGTLVCNLGSINLGPHKAIADLASVFGAKHGLLLLLQPLHRFSNVIAVASTNRVLDAQRLRQRTHDIERLFVDNGLTATQLQASLLPSLELPPCPSEPTDQGSLPG